MIRVIRIDKDKYIKRAIYKNGEFIDLFCAFTDVEEQRCGLHCALLEITDVIAVKDNVRFVCCARAVRQPFIIGRLEGTGNEDTEPGYGEGNRVIQPLTTPKKVNDNGDTNAK